MKKIIPTIVFVLFSIPLAVSAHASPVEMQPHSGAQLESAPTVIQIRFSERLESGSSRIKVTNEAGERVEEGMAQVSADGYSLTVPLKALEGIYAITWSVVSKDDGHFTRGSYAFSVGSRVAPTSLNEEVVMIASTSEAGLTFVEFLGNSILWGVFALYLLWPDSRLRKYFFVLALFGAVFAFLGACGQLLLKSHQLAGLHGVGIWEALHLYTHTVAGHSTIVRGIALTLGGVLAALFAFRSRRTTLVILGVPLIVFAYFRALISHATANPFHTEFSIAVNFVHVIEKDLWLGVLLVLCVLFASRQREALVPELLPRTFALLSANLALLSASAGYIVWLHLKSFSNIVGSAWGQAFLPLLVCAAVLIALHSYHVFGLWRRPRSVKKYLAATLGAATAAAAFVVFFSSVVIITSPPPHDAVRAFSVTDQGTRIALERSIYEDGMTLLTIEGTHTFPTVVIGAREGGLQPALVQRFVGGYVFPSALIGTETKLVTVIVPRADAYDAQASFELSSESFAKPVGHGRTFDLFTTCMILLSLTGVGYAALLRFAGPRFGDIELRHAGTRAVVGFVCVSVVMLTVAAGVSALFKNEFALACVSDGNMWHMMQPTYAGVPVSAEAREGCMWGMGQYFYQFSDAREYYYLNSFTAAQVALATHPKVIRAQIPTELTFTLTDSDGSPATLLVDMEKYLHAVIVSEDESVFAHIHPDDVRPLTQEDIDASTFTVNYTFPKAGTYLVSVDFAHGTQLESKQFTVQVEGGGRMDKTPRTYSSPGVFEGYTVTMDSSGAGAGEVTTLSFSVAKNGTPVTDMQPYLSAVSHISVVKNDLSAFIHTHGEYHPPGTPYPPIAIKNGKIIHSMATMVAPATFGPNFEAHVLFPTSGRYTVWAQINVGGTVIPTSFTLDVE